MHPIEFDGHNMVIAKDQPEYLPLPALVTIDGQVTSCWAMTWRERLRALWTGRVYVTNLTFRQPLQPQLLSLNPPNRPPPPPLRRQQWPERVSAKILKPAAWRGHPPESTHGNDQ